jgi:GT2 family glycosyltransferase
MKIAAIILNYNSVKDTMKCIEFLQKQKLNEELHVIVVDNNSSEELGIRNEELWSTVNFLSPMAQRPMVQQSTEVIYADENRGYSAGNNIGLRRATELGAKYALVINPDMELVDVNYIAKLVEVMERDEDVVRDSSQFCNCCVKCMTAAQNLGNRDDMF